MQPVKCSPHFRHAEVDPRDRDFAEIVPTIAAQARPPAPESHPAIARETLRGSSLGRLVVLEERTPISDQASLNSCWGNAVADACEQVMPEVVQISRLDVYWKGRLATHEQCKDEGVDPRPALGAVIRLGICRESLWPYDESKVNERPSLEALEEAYDHRIDSYRVIKSYGARRVAEIKAALDAGLPVVFGADVGPEIFTTDGRTAIGPPRKVEGGHAMVVWGYWERDDGSTWFLIRNSWGVDWGAKGYCWFTESYLTDLGTSGFFVPIGVPTFEAPPTTERSP